MASIAKLSIRGVRAFSPNDDEQVIGFCFPLTIIVGANGCGTYSLYYDGHKVRYIPDFYQLAHNYNVQLILYTKQYNTQVRPRLLNPSSMRLRDHYPLETNLDKVLFMTQGQWGNLVSREVLNYDLPISKVQVWL